LFSVESGHRRTDPKMLSCLKSTVVSPGWLERVWKLVILMLLPQFVNQKFVLSLSIVSNVGGFLGVGF
jgi:hypothetical protein